MTLIKSISGIRGTIGGRPLSGLTPIDITTLAAGYGRWLLEQHEHPRVVIGRDGRLTGPLVQSFVTNTLIMMGIDVIDGDLSTTPTIEMGVPYCDAHGGIIITASHNPMEWNALKLLNEAGEFLSKEDGEKILAYADDVQGLEFANLEKLGFYHRQTDLLEHHLASILALPYVDIEGIRNHGFHVVIDPINSSGAFAIPALLDQLNVTYTLIHDEIAGEFGHNPEPLADHLKDLSDKVIEEKAHLGISVDPDVDRLAFVCEDGTMFGEENTLVAVSDYLLAKKPGPTVSNLSSTRGLNDIAIAHGQTYSASAVGEVNVVAEMKRTNAVIGGEGNGGVILPDLHYGRDALAGLALMLSYVADKNKPLSAIKKSLPTYEMAKRKVSLGEGLNPQSVLDHLMASYADHPGLNTVDGVKINFENNWVHIRKSNTEPIVRVYTEAPTKAEADALAQEFVTLIENSI